MLSQFKEKEMNIGIYVNPNNDNTRALSLINKQIKERKLILDNDNPDVVIFAGGDGTFLRCVQHYHDKLDQIKLVGINFGNLGFFYDFEKNELGELFDSLENGMYKEITYPLLHANLGYENRIEKIFAVNEIRIENPFHTLICDVYIDDIKLETFRGNGLMVCSPLGSSAYNKSLGGTLIDHKLRAIELTEIGGIQNNITHSIASSLVLNGDSHIRFEADFQKLVVGYDFLNSQEHNPQTIEIFLSNEYVHLLVKKDHSYVKSLKRAFVK